ncbi:MAG: DEAD/DEAH box helicase family protein [Syntrophaceae bacterium]|nr:DEAD/DEAH box helicase family protein [Syntrophaceae bacterium]
MENGEGLGFQLEKALEECAFLRAENERLKKMLGLSPEKKDSPVSATPSHPAPFLPHLSNDSALDAKIALFRSLFRGREDVYPVRWESQKGNSGYSPACVHEWKRDICGKPAKKCGECENREFKPVTDRVIHDHLTGRHTVGVYPLLTDETCWFLAVDFDKNTWQDDAITFVKICDEMGVPASLERSRSGEGGHVWIFFNRPVQASLARRLGAAILTRSMERRHEIGLDSYDRLFPSQDTMPKGGFGNLIALPLQFGPREKGNSVFVNRNLKAFPDQWAFLSRVSKMEAEGVERIIREASREGAIIGVRTSLPEDGTEEDPWVMKPSKKRFGKIMEGPLPQSVPMVLSKLVYIEKKGLPAGLINQIIRLAAFQNPEFYKAQAMRLSTFGKPRIICCAEDFPLHIGLPRGCLSEALELLRSYGIKPEIIEEYFRGVPIDALFAGELRPAQKEAGIRLLDNDHGVLSAPPAFGKTVVAAWLIAQRRVNTLVLVHRTQLLDQWRERLAVFLGLPKEEIGQIGGGKKRITGVIEIGLMQSLNRQGQVKDLVAEYGQVIVDECHHIPAFSFELVLKQVKAKYILGLSAIPIRKDGHHPIIMMQCGPVRFIERAKAQAAGRPFRHEVLTRYTDFKMPAMAGDVKIHEIYATLVCDESRNQMIINDLRQALKMRRSPIFLTERVEHLELFEARLRDFARNIIVLKGGMGDKKRQLLKERIQSIPDSEERVILSTGRYIGEGFDDPRLDTLFLVMPISWRGTLQQYVGRLHRLHDQKRVVQVYDYVDKNVPLLVRMYEKRVKGYRAIGYVLQDEKDEKESQWREDGRYEKDRDE